MGRTNVAVDESVAYVLADEAERENKTLYAFTNELLRSSLRVCKEGGSVSEIYPSWRFLKMVKDLDSVPLPGDLLEKMLARLYSADQKWLLQTWFEQGERLGTYLRMFQPDFEMLSKMIREMQFLLPVKKVEIGSVEAEGEKRFVVGAVGAGLSPESTSCAEQLIRGILSAYSMKVLSSHIAEGIIEISAKPEA
jgi:hypothetical protein